MIGRRRFVRFPFPGDNSRALLAEAQDESIRVRNVAYGGLCIELARPLLEGGIYQFWLELGTPLRDIVFATAQVRWVTQVGDAFRCGVQVLETNRPWLGPVAMWRSLPEDKVNETAEVDPPGPDPIGFDPMEFDTVESETVESDYPAEAVASTRGSRANTLS